MAKYIIQGTKGRWFHDRGEGSTAYPELAYQYTEEELRKHWPYWGYGGGSFKPTLRQVRGS